MSSETSYSRLADPKILINYRRMTILLPPELWRQVFEFAAYEDPAHFWLLGRQVNKTWNLEILNTYRDMFLRDPNRCLVSFNVYSEYCFEMGFNRFDEHDKSRVIFSGTQKPWSYPESWGQERVDEHETQINYLWRLNVVRYLQEFEKQKGRQDLTPHILSVFGSSNDTALVGLQADYDKGEISFLWEPTLHTFFLENAEINRRNAMRAQDTDLEWRDNIIFSRAAKDVWCNALNTFVRDMEQNVKAVRRERFKKQYEKERGSGSWKDAEVDTFQEGIRLRKIRHMSERREFLLR